MPATGNPAQQQAMSKSRAIENVFIECPLEWGMITRKSLARAELTRRCSIPTLPVFLARKPGAGRSVDALNFTSNHRY